MTHSKKQTTAMKRNFTKFRIAGMVKTCRDILDSNLPITREELRKTAIVHDYLRSMILLWQKGSAEEFKMEVTK